MLFPSLAQFKHLFTGEGQRVDLTVFRLIVISYTGKEEQNSVHESWLDLQVVLVLGIVRPEA